MSTHLRELFKSSRAVHHILKSAVKRGLVIIPERHIIATPALLGHSQHTCNALRLRIIVGHK